MLNNNSFGKTIKAAFSICAVAVFLTACSTSSTQDTSSTSVDTGSSVSTSGSSTGSTTTTAPKLATTVYFDFDSSALRSDSVSVLNAHAAALKANPRSVRLEGHADERGTREYNMALGERRAQAVRAYLESKGVTSPIEVISYGEERPAVVTHNDFAWQQNRRVEIK